MNKNRLILIIILLILGSVSIWYKSKSENLIKSSIGLKEGACFIQYNTCEFLDQPSEKWEKKCDSIYKEVKIANVGRIKVVIEEKNGNQSIYPKDFFIEKKPKTSDRSIENSILFYEAKCSENFDKKKEIKIEENLKEVNVEKIEALDKCFALLNDCENKERWQVDQKYCHPYRKVVKILEEGHSNFRVVLWNGNGEVFRNKPLSLRDQQYSLLKDEFFKLNYKEVDCFEQMNKYKDTFNPLTGK